jgi:RecT family
MLNPIINALATEYVGKFNEIDAENYEFDIGEYTLQIHVKKPSMVWPVIKKDTTTPVKRDTLPKEIKNVVSQMILKYNTLKVDGVPDTKFNNLESSPEMEVEIIPPDPHISPREGRGETRRPNTKQTTLPATQVHRGSSPLFYKFTDEQVEAMKGTVAKGASRAEFEMFMYLASRYNLDPFLHEIYFSDKLKIMTSRDGYLKYAHSHPDFEGIRSMAVRANDDFEVDLEHDTVKHKFGKGERGPVIGAWAIVYRKGFRPVIAYADLSEYKKTGGAWQYVSAMICKCAEVFALKRQFAITGLVTQEELSTDNEDTMIIDAQYVVREDIECSVEED